MDLMDMEHCVDGEFHHICHVVEHFSQFHFLFPLKTSSPSEVARGLEERVMAYLGPPRVLFSSSDPQLVYKVSRILFGGWGSDMTLGRSHTSQMTSHKGIANTNELVMKQLVKLRAYHYDPAAHFPWTTWLPRVMYCLNMHGSLPSKHSKGQVMRKLGHDSRPGIATMFPYQVMFGRAPPGKCPCWCEERGHDTDQDTDGMEEEEQERDDRAKHSLLIAKTELVSECDQY